jgi:phenylalanyl-tRNA synthetase alpha chain
MDAFDRARQLLAEINDAQPTDIAGLEVFRLQFLGTKGALKDLMGEIASVPKEQKKEYGLLVNEAKAAAETKFTTLRDQFEAAAELAAISDLDLTAPGLPIEMGAMHPVSIVQRRIVDIFARIGFTVAEDREIEDDWHNFGAMNLPEDHPARDMQDTFYLADGSGWLLRTHTSSVQARVMGRQQPPIRIVAPGRVYRNETISARSHCQFHQVEGLVIDKDVSFADMKQTLLYFAHQMYGSTKIQLRPSFFPFTEPSAEMDIWLGTETEDLRRLTKGTGWMEIMGCGMVDPAVLTNMGLDPNEYSGYAFGMGVERQALALYGIPDIRLLFENDVRFLKQFSSVL